MIELLDPRSVPLWTAFFAGVVSVIGLIIAKESRVSDFRQAWIDALRGEIASLVARVNAINEWQLAIEARSGKDITDTGHVANPRAAEDSVAERYKVVHPDLLKMEEAHATIELRLKPNDEKAQPLLDKAQDLVGKVRLDRPACRKELKSLEKDLLEESKQYLKGEWERVKKGEWRYRLAVWSSLTIAAIGVVALTLGLAGLMMGEDPRGPLTLVKGTYPAQERSASAMECRAKAIASDSPIQAMLELDGTHANMPDQQAFCEPVVATVDVRLRKQDTRQRNKQGG